MKDTVVESLVVDLLLWVDARERAYVDVMDARSTSCPKVPVWEDANDRTLLEQETVDARRVVRVTEAGRALLNSRGL